MLEVSFAKVLTFALIICSLVSQNRRILSTRPETTVAPAEVGHI